MSLFWSDLVFQQTILSPKNSLVDCSNFVMAARKKTLAGLTGTVAVAPGVTTTPQVVTPGAPAVGGLLEPIKLAPIQDTLHSVLSDLIGPDGNKLLTSVQIAQLDEVTMLNGEKFFSLDMDDRPIVYQIVSQIYTWGYDAVYTALTMADLLSRIGFYFHDSPGMAFSRHKSRIDAEIFRNKIEVAKGVFKCKKCGSEETIAVEKQMRAADEPTTIKVTCIHCGTKWQQ